MDSYTRNNCYVNEIEITIIQILVFNKIISIDQTFNPKIIQYDMYADYEKIKFEFKESGKPYCSLGSIIDWDDYERLMHNVRNVGRDSSSQNIEYQSDDDQVSQLEIDGQNETIMQALIDQERDY
ncbi:hypothetical protein ABPG74_022070 [Tetrahymena malaccensis]